MSLGTARGIVALAACGLLAGLLGTPLQAAEAKFLNPFAGDPEAINEGRQQWLSRGCSGCHGVLGGGGMGKPVLDDTWIFGSDDQTLYNLIKGRIANQTMPRTFAGVKSMDVWKLLAYVRSLYKGDPALINWGLTPPDNAAELIAAIANEKPTTWYKPPKGLEDMEIPLPEDNDITPGKIRLGEQLFFDKRLSKNKDMSCETCHNPEKGWADGQQFSKKFDGSLNTRNTPTLFGVAFYPELEWDGRVQGLEAATLDMMRSQMGSDLGLVGTELEGIAGYASAFEREMGGPPTGERIAKALATFQRTIYAGDTPFDNLPAGRADSDMAKGFKVFSEVAHCSLCHLPPFYSDTLYHNMGVGTDKENPDLGRGKVLADQAEAAGKPAPPEAEIRISAFKTASLRGVLLTAPYFHDGRAKTLDDAAGLMLQGGIKNPHLDEKLKVWPITDEERRLLFVFLRSLTPKTEIYLRPSLP